MASPTITVSCVSNVFTRMMHFQKAGDFEIGHRHAFDHITVLASGSLKVLINGVATECHAPQMIVIDKDTIHSLIALEDNTVACCVHAIRDGELVTDIVDPAMIPKTGKPLYLPIAKSLMDNDHD